MVFPKSANQPNEMPLTICNAIFHINCFRLMRDWKLESLANGKEISAVPFRTEKRSTSEGTPQFPNGISGKFSYHLTSSRNFRIFWQNGRMVWPWFSCETVCSHLIAATTLYSGFFRLSLVTRFACDIGQLVRIWI